MAATLTNNAKTETLRDMMDCYADSSHWGGISYLSAVTKDSEDTGPLGNQFHQFFSGAMRRKLRAMGARERALWLCAQLSDCHDPLWSCENSNSIPGATYASLSARLVREISEDWSPVESNR